MDEFTEQSLSRLVGSERLAAGIGTLPHLQSRFRDLCSGKLCYGPGDDNFAQYFLYYLTPAVEEITHDGWVDRHLHDFALLAISPSLTPCCRTTALELFGFEAFHVAIQFNPCADGMVQKVCHDPGDRRDHVRQITRDILHYSVANGSYPPPGTSYVGTRQYTATNRGILDLGEWSTYRPYWTPPRK